MGWKKGQSGNPSGRTQDKAFAEQLRIAVSADDEESGKRKLRLIAEKLVAKAIEGEGWAIQQVADRLDGKPAQESTVTINDKRDAVDWSRDELVAFLNDEETSGEGTSKARRSNRKSDRIH